MKHALHALRMPKGTCLADMTFNCEKLCPYSIALAVIELHFSE